MNDKITATTWLLVFAAALLVADAPPDLLSHFFHSAILFGIAMVGILFVNKVVRKELPVGVHILIFAVSVLLANLLYGLFVAGS